jgi:hypothetical protein
MRKNAVLVRSAYLSAVDNVRTGAQDKVLGRLVEECDEAKASRVAILGVPVDDRTGHLDLQLTNKVFY